MNPAEGRAESAAVQLNQMLVEAGLPILQDEQSKQVNVYISLILRWNARINLTAIRDENAILSRHFFESIACAHMLPAGIAALLDFGSGAGFPGIPIALCRREIAVTLAESQGKKAAFLQEAVRTLQLSTKVHSGRAENLQALFDCVTLRAVDRMESALQAAAPLVRPGGWLASMTTNNDLPSMTKAAGAEFSWSEPLRLPGGGQKVLALGQRIDSRA